ncbi:CrtT-methyltransferase-like protein [Pseudonocardia sp. Ae717_Ps2]|uniref:class I SAM-dependent methyltransferase n=1 Tax=unclassified Pseudonocardia TaxID=2619320 RepID=UPI00094AF623|nr:MULTISPECIES: class I SAM-dependent methyltransferase [unclassified Pseudonocardia]OLM12418.1 CrtT-methyltransferase-like protein [Pseudonocardia sp. Ae505_Ps2]OLM29746.1 CrtT-methyltransferase-like protein [Pseudonocardia sp. Ae717_Ps2]
MSGEAWQESDQIRPATVHRAYGRGAAGYDAFVATLPGYRTHLRVSASRMGLGDGHGLRLLDVGCGTGVSTEALLTSVGGAEVVAVDASAEMLAVARRKNWSPRVTFVHSRLETLAEAGVEGPFDGILASFLVTNLPDAEHGLRRLLSLLAPGAPLAVHDYAVSGRSRMRWTAANWTWMLPMASLRWGAADLARYRARRIATAGGPEQMVHRMERAGFDDVRVQTVGGVQQHLVHTFLGRRPDEPDVVGERKERRARGSAIAAAGWRPRRDEPVPAHGDTTGPVDEGGPEDPGYAETLPDQVLDGDDVELGEGDAAVVPVSPPGAPAGPAGRTGDDDRDDTGDGPDDQDRGGSGAPDGPTPDEDPDTRPRGHGVARALRYGLPGSRPDSSSPGARPGPGPGAGPGPDSAGPDSAGPDSAGPDSAGLDSADPGAAGSDPAAAGPGPGEPDPGATGPRRPTPGPRPRRPVGLRRPGPPRPRPGEAPPPAEDDEPPTPPTGTRRV